MSTVEIIGNIASLIVLISLMMSSIIKLRWINLIGSFVFGVYGILIKSFPVAFMNFAIVGMNIYYLFKIYTYNSSYNIIEANKNSELIKHYLLKFENDILKFFPKFSLDIKYDSSIIILRDNSPASILLFKEVNSNSREILLDYAFPEYRDFKIGSYLYKEKEFFINKGIKQLIIETNNSKHQEYLNKMGFVKEEDYYKLIINE